MKLPIDVKELDPKERINNFKEVVLGYSEEQALAEASRCLQCANPTCIKGCPVGIDIKKFIYHITQKDYEKAFFTIKEKNNFPSICGRVCPAEYQCRKSCVLNKNKKDIAFCSPETINIHFLERFVGDYGVANNLAPRVEKDKQLSKVKVAVVGSGPAGLSLAGELARVGIEVDIFESLHKMGGVLGYGIPPFRLVRNILEYEINYLKSMGVKMFPNIVVGRTKTINDLFNQGYKAIFLGLGAGTPYFLNIEGKNLCNVYSANEFLTRVNLMGAYKFPEFHTPVNIGKNIVVIGGGNTAVDAARVALRLQRINEIKTNVRILYRRSESEMPARRLEIEHAKAEGVKLEFLSQPVSFIDNGYGYIKKIKALKCELGPPDESGRRRPVPIPESEFDTDCDLAIVAIGLGANKVLTEVTPGLEVDKYSDIIVDKDTMETSIKGVYAGGDIVGGEGTVIEAMGMAKKAARSIKKYLDTLI